MWLIPLALKWLDSHQYLALWLEGIALVAIFIWDRLDASQQHDQTLAQMEIMRNQARATETAANAANKSAQATEEAAKAASRNVDILIAKERGKLQFGELDYFSPEPPGSLQITYITFDVLFSGSTDVYVLGSNAEAYLSQTLGAKTNPMVTVPMSIPDVITPHTEIRKQTTVIHTRPRLEVEDIDAIRNGTRHLHFWAWIEYKDLFGGEWRVTFRRYWQTSDIPGMKGEWVKCGPPYDNRETKTN
jgi:hypothetical protein